MSRRLVYTPAAVRDLGDILDYIARDNPGAAIRVADVIRETIGRLDDFPMTGRTLNEPGIRGHRVLIIDDYLVFYVLVEAEVQIRRILHGARRYHHLARK